MEQPRDVSMHAWVEYHPGQEAAAVEALVDRVARSGCTRIVKCPQMVSPYRARTFQMRRGDIYIRGTARYYSGMGVMCRLEMMGEYE